MRIISRLMKHVYLEKSGTCRPVCKMKPDNK
jgi:hypothetical protein